MVESTGNGTIELLDFSKIRANIDIPDLIEIQKRSYDHFLQIEMDPERRADKGLQAALSSVFPIADYNNTAILEFSNYTLGTPKYDVRECLEQGMTYAVPLKVRVRLVVFDKEDKSAKKKVLDVREQEVEGVEAGHAGEAPGHVRVLDDGHGDHEAAEGLEPVLPRVQADRGQEEVEEEDSHRGRFRRGHSGPCGARAG